MLPRSKFDRWHCRGRPFLLIPRGRNFVEYLVISTGFHTPKYFEGLKAHTDFSLLDCQGAEGTADPPQIAFQDVYE